jgi:hypothetical protein
MELTTGRRVVYHSDALDAIESEEAIRRDYEEQDAWGLLTSIDLHGCNPDMIRDASEVTRHVHELCDLIGMKRFGDTVVVNFGEDEKTHLSLVPFLPSIFRPCTPRRTLVRYRVLCRFVYC